MEFKFMCEVGKTSQRQQTVDQHAPSINELHKQQ